MAILQQHGACLQVSALTKFITNSFIKSNLTASVQCFAPGHALHGCLLARASDQGLPSDVWVGVITIR